MTSALGSLREHRALAVLLALLFVLSLLILLAACVVYLRRRLRQRAAGAAGGAVDRQRLLRVVHSFRRQLPASVREALPDCGHFLVLGAAGVGKSTLIARLTDWQAQASQFLPSYTADPLLQVYLSRQLVAYELSASLLSASTREASAALRALFLGLQGGRPPTALVVLSMSALREATPDRLRQQAQLVRGKLNLLAEVLAAPVRTRICVTGMERVPGYSPLARFLRHNEVDYAPDLGARAQRDASEAFEGITPHLPRLLTTQPVATFDAIVELLANATEQLKPLAQFLDELTELSLAGACPELDRLYFFSPAVQEQLGNPFALPPHAARSIRRPSRWQRLFPFHGQLSSPGHALAALLLMLLSVASAAFWVRRHGKTVEDTRAAVHSFSDSLERTARAGHVPSNSGFDALLQRANQAGRQLDELSATESRIRPLGWLYREDKAALRAEYTAGLRRGYLLPLLQTAVRQRSRERILYTLAALYATPSGALGALLRAQAAEFQSRIGLPERIAFDYLRLQDAPYAEPALTTLPPLDEDLPLAQRQAVESSQPWLRFLGALTAALSRATIPPTELEPLRNQAATLRSALALSERAVQERQLYHLLSEETPLNMVGLFGRSAHVLNPAPFLEDNREALTGLLQFIDESSKGYSRTDRMSLFRLLKWINDLSKRPTTGLQEYQIVIDDQSFRIRQQAILDLLFRSRQRALTGGQSGWWATTASAHSKKPCRDRRAQRCKSPGPRPRRAARLASPEAFSKEEITPKIVSLYMSDSPPAPIISEIYNRNLLQKEILPLLHELRQALAGSVALSPEEKLALSRLVQAEVRTYARNYCTALQAAYDAYDGFPASASLPELRTALLGLAAPGSSFVEHLRTITENARTEGQNEPYLRPLHDCLSPYRPLAALVEPSKEGGYPGLKPYKDILTQLASELVTAPNAGTPPTATPERALPTTAAAAPSAASAVAKEPAQPSPASTTTASLDATLLARLSPAAKTALQLLEAGPQQSAIEHFLDEAGIAHSLRRPFLRPLSVIYRRGMGELESALSRHAKEEIAPPLQRIFAGFPFKRRSSQEITVEQLDQLNPTSGVLWNSVKRNYIEPGFLQERSGQLIAAPAPIGSEFAPPRLSNDLLLLLNQALRLRRVLFREDGTRQPLRFRVRMLPIPAAPTHGLSLAVRKPQPTASFLSVGKTQIVGFNQQENGKPLEVEWWTPGTAAVGIEYTPTESTRTETRSLEIGETQWPLYRLLMRAAISDESTVYFQLARESESSRWSIGFVFDPDPWSLLAPARGIPSTDNRSTP